MITTTDTADLLYGAPAIARWLGLTVKQARYRIEMGMIPTFRIGGTVCARKPSLTAWLNECERDSSYILLEKQLGSRQNI